jgi:hypothetical protein
LVLRAALSPALYAVLIWAHMLAGSARAQSSSAGAVEQMSLPGGIRGAVASINDRVTPDRSQFLLEFIRRTYNRPPIIKNAARDAALQALLGQFDRSNGSVSGAPEMVPLPLAQSVWIKTVFAGRESPHTLAGAILRSRGAALL